MPVFTNEEASWGFNGLTVVLAFLNEMTSETETAMPIISIKTEVDIRSSLLMMPLNEKLSSKYDKPHRAKEKISATSGGGIKVSSVFIFFVLN